MKVMRQTLPEINVYTHLFGTLEYSLCQIIPSMDYRDTLVTRPMLQRRPKRTELRSVDSYIQILSRFQKCKPKFPPPSLPCTKPTPYLIPLRARTQP